MKLPRRKPRPAPTDEVTVFEALQLLQQIDQAVEREDYVLAFRLVGITDEIARNAATLQDLFDIANVRLADLARIAKIQPRSE